MADWPIWKYPAAAAQLAVRENIPAGVAYNVLTALGATVNQGDFDRFYGQAQTAKQLVGDTGQLELDQTPPAELIQTRTTRTSTGYQYQFMVAAVDQESDQEIEIPYSILTPDLITPGEGIQSALVAQTLRAPDYNLKVLSARLTGVYRLEPQEAS